MKNIYDLIIIGAGPSGLSAAIYAGRAKLRTLVVDKEEFGGQIKITSDVANYPGFLNIDGKELGKKMKEQAQALGAKIITAEIANVELKDDIKKLYTSTGEVLEAMSVIIATGANPRKLGFTGEREFTGRGVAYCATCDGEFFTGKDIFVIGGGYAAAEEAIYLTRYGKKVTLVVRNNDFSCAKTIASRVLNNDKIEVLFNTELLEVGGEKVLKYAKFFNNSTKEKWAYNVEPANSSFGVFVFVGYTPMSDLFKGQVDIDEDGYITTDEDLMTNVAGVYAAGDIRPKKLRQLVTAVSDGAVALINAEKHIYDIKEKLNIEIKPDEPKEEHNKSILDDELKGQLAPIFEKFANVVTINAILVETGNEEMIKLSSEIKTFLEDFASTTDKIKIEFYNKGQNTKLENQLNTDIYPVIAMLDNEGNYSGTSFSGVPGGHEFNSFILALYNIAGPGQTVEEDLLKRVKDIKCKLDLKICVTLYCTYCPELVTAAQFLAVNNENVNVQVVDVSRFAEVKDQYSVMSVPAMVVNGEVEFGAKDLTNLVTYIEQLK